MTHVVALNTLLPSGGQWGCLPTTPAVNRSHLADISALWLQWHEDTTTALLYSSSQEMWCVYSTGLQRVHLATFVYINKSRTCHVTYFNTEYINNSMSAPTCGWRLLSDDGRDDRRLLFPYLIIRCVHRYAMNKSPSIRRLNRRAGETNEDIIYRLNIELFCSNRLVRRPPSSIRIQNFPDARATDRSRKSKV